MTVGQARESAKRWMNKEAVSVPGFRGAYTAGSTNWLPDDAELSAESDLDVMVVVSDAERDGTRERFVYHGALLEASYLERDRFASADRILGDYHLAPSFHTTKFMVDPFGDLTPLRAVVSRDYAKRSWVRRRCANARDKVLRLVRSIQPDGALMDQSIGCLFAAGLTTHVLLVAGLRNPTVRTRYEAVRDLLAQYGRLEFQETLLGLLGAAHKEADREAMFWLAVTDCRSRKLRGIDSPGDVLVDLGLSTSHVIRARAAEIEQTLPRVCEVAEAIAAANPEIEDD